MILRNILSSLVVVVLLGGCQQQTDCDCAPKGVGFIKQLEGEQWYIGTDTAIGHYTDFITALNAKNIEGAVAKLADTAFIANSNGMTLQGRDVISDSMTVWITEGGQFQYEIMSAVSVDLRPDTLGEWVMAGLKYTFEMDSIMEQRILHMDAYIIDGKIHQLMTTAAKMPKEE